MSYKLLDSGNEEKLERFGDFTIIRPAPQALWKPQAPKLWKEANATFKRDEPWKGLPKSWNIDFKSLTFKMRPTSFGHLGIFPEHAHHWNWMRTKLKPGAEVLNLFAYSGATTVYLAKLGHRLCHLDASKGMVEWARQNATLNELDDAPIRWIVDDTLKFLKREIKRKKRYDALLLDPPSFGRGSQGQVFKIERDLLPLLDLCRQVVRPKPAFVLLTCHTPGLTPEVLGHLMEETFPRASTECGEMVIPSEKFSLPSGSYARCST
ncbi:MAG: Ribosomal RNA large subunit methyltransferase K [Chlamydiae bacterium]|nr:Ribosomal RNA large subunit methyltransferase K [Chlamydiota bacterium]